MRLNPKSICENGRTQKRAFFRFSANVPHTHAVLRDGPRRLQHALAEDHTITAINRRSADGFL